VSRWRDRRRRCGPSRASLLPLLLAANGANAQLGPVETRGFIEYQHQQTSGDSLTDSRTNLGTWRADASTYVWEPWVLQLDGSLGITKTVTKADVVNDGHRSSTLITGRLQAGLFQQSPFPFRAYAEQLDSRTDAEIAELGLQTSTVGFLSQFATRGGGRYSLNYRKSDNDRMIASSDSFRPAFTDEIWELNVNKGIGSNFFRLASLVGETRRYESSETLERTTHNLRHKFRSSPRFYTDSTLFLSDETFEFDHSDNLRKFNQFNGSATWRPSTERPLLITSRALLQSVEAGQLGVMSDSRSMAITTVASYQISERLAVLADAGVTERDMDLGEDGSSLFQRVRSRYRSTRHRFGRSNYRWGSSLEFGNRRDRQAGEDEDSVQNVRAQFDHTLMRTVRIGDYRQLQISFAQQLTADRNSEDQPSQILSNSIFGTFSRQNGRVATYIRLSATDRRAYGDNEGTNQLVNLQASTMARSGRNRSWNGSITLQYGRSSQEMLEADTMDRESVSYSADLTYRHANLLDVTALNFSSELRLLSEEFLSDDPLDLTFGDELERTDTMWRNRLTYRIGLLEFDLQVTLREVSDSLSTRAFFKVRRYYGAV